MNFRKVKRQCSVRGCRNMNCYHIAKTREVGYSVIICPDCLKDAIKSIEETEKLKEENNAPKEKSNKVKEFVCEKCGKVYKKEQAYLTHIGQCKGGEYE